MTTVRTSITIDADLAEGGRRAVAEGRAASLSAWINDALRVQLANEQRLAALAAAVADFEAANGAITGEEITAQHRADRDAAAQVRSRHRPGAA
jgi:Arc/MetJ-type ribon-helix-helix transcriptional regulator